MASQRYVVGVTKDRSFAVLDFLQDVDNDQDLYKGVSRKTGFPPRAAFKMDPAYHRKAKSPPLGDFLWNPNHLIVGSARARAVIEAHGGSGLEILPVTVKDHGGRPISEPYVIIHAVGAQPCLDEKKSKPTRNKIDKTRIDSVSRLVIDESKIPPDVAVVRMAGFYKVVLFRRDLSERIVGEQLTGIDFVELDEWE